MSEPDIIEGEVLDSNGESIVEPKLNFKNGKELLDRAFSYFRSCDEDKKPYVLSELAIYIGTDRETLVTFPENDPLFDSVRLIVAKCEAYLEQFLLTNKNTDGAKFILKNGFGWKDKGEGDGDTTVRHILEIEPATYARLLRRHAEKLNAPHPVDKKGVN